MFQLIARHLLHTLNIIVVESFTTPHHYCPMSVQPLPALTVTKEEKKWRLWKEAEEKQLRNLGVTEDDIEQLRIHDWAIFNSDRRYYQRVQETGTYLDELAEDTTQPEVKTVEDFLDSIENQHLYQVLIKVDRLTLQIALMKIQGYSTREIAVYLDITEKAVYRRMDRLKEKLKKFFE